MKAVAFAAALGGVAVAPAAADELVRFIDGGSLEVSSCVLQQGRAVLRFQGGELTVPASRILSVAPVAPAPGLDRGDVAGAIQGSLPAASELPGADGLKGPSAAGIQAGENGVATGAKPATGDLDALVKEAAALHGLHPDLLGAVIAAESSFDDGVVSPKGAMGLMQLMPATARELDVSDPFDPRQNVEAGARYLRQLLDRHRGPDGEESFVRALAAYNAGGGRVARYNGLPPYRETIEYVRRVLRYYVSPPTR